ncbi:hypothetical protein [Kitasatospora sp. NPDC088134]|uniref:hypothetical protein n=1 Tax=Kitasatospora sp. NPDC088134 TaxID=3364071 RepID=UPI0037F13203
MKIKGKLVRIASVSAAVVGMGLATAMPAHATATGCTDGGSNCIQVVGSGLNVTKITSSYSKAPSTTSDYIADLRIEIPGQSAQYYYGYASSTQNSPVGYNWSSGHTGNYPNNTRICTSWAWTGGWACVTVHS